MSNLVETTVYLVPIDCCVCGQVFGVTKSTNQRLREQHESFYCPAGHKQYFAGKSDLEVAREKIAARERELQEQREFTDRIRKQRDEAERKALAEKRVKTRYKNDRDRIKARVGNGVCPCCNRTFQDLSKHMQCKHPKFVTPEE